MSITIGSIELAVIAVAVALAYVVWQHVAMRKLSSYMMMMEDAMEGIAAGDIEASVDSEGDIHLRRIR